MRFVCLIFVFFLSDRNLVIKKGKTVIHVSRKRDPGEPSSHELAEQTEISERKNIEKLFPVKKIDVFAG